MLNALALEPIATVVATGVQLGSPLIYMRIVAPSYVAAAWIQVPSVGYNAAELIRAAVLLFNRRNTFCPADVCERLNSNPALPDSFFTRSCVAAAPGLIQAATVIFVRLRLA